MMKDNDEILEDFKSKRVWDALKKTNKGNLVLDTFVLNVKHFF